MLFAIQVTGGYVIQYHPEGEGKDKPVVTVDFTPPFKHVPMIPGLEEATRTKFPADLATAEARDFFDALCVEHGIKCPEPRTTARLLDKLVGHEVFNNELLS
jgi:lysyl-tRNA synthetase class 2